MTVLHSRQSETSVGAWRSLVARTLGVREVAGSNPAAPTIPPKQPFNLCGSIPGSLLRVSSLSRNEFLFFAVRVVLLQGAGFKPAPYQSVLRTSTTAQSLLVRHLFLLLGVFPRGRSQTVESLTPARQTARLITAVDDFEKLSAKENNDGTVKR